MFPSTSPLYLSLSPSFSRNPEMVARISKRTPTKSIKHNHHHHHHGRRRCSHHHKRSPGKTVSASTVISSIHKSLSSCRRRLLKIFNKIVRISTPKKPGYTILKTQKKELEDDQFLVPKALFPQKDNNAPLLPPLFTPGKRTVFLDLDETLIHSKADPPPEKYDFSVRPRIDGEIMNFYVTKRPGVDAFLEFLSEKYEVVVFTAGLKEYASLVLDRLDKKGLISHRLYRDSCKPLDGKYVKDLSEIGRELDRLVLVDDNPNAYIYQPENAIPVKPFMGDESDSELLRLVQFFDGCESFLDMRDAVKEFFAPTTRRFENLDL